MTAGSGSGDIFFVPQRPYVVLGTLREQLLYPTWSDAGSTLPGGATVTQTRSFLHRSLRGLLWFLASVHLLEEEGLDELQDASVCNLSQ